MVSVVGLAWAWSKGRAVIGVRFGLLYIYSLVVNEENKIKVNFMFRFVAGKRGCKTNFFLGDGVKYTGMK